MKPPMKGSDIGPTSSTGWNLPSGPRYLLHRASSCMSSASNVNDAVAIAERARCKSDYPPCSLVGTRAIQGYPYAFTNGARAAIEAGSYWGGGEVAARWDESNRKRTRRRRGLGLGSGLTRVDEINITAPATQPPAAVVVIPTYQEVPQRTHRHHRLLHLNVLQYTVGAGYLWQED